MKMYKPLPHGLFIEESGIEGQGLHTNVKLAEGTNLGISHVEVGELLLRTHSVDLLIIQINLIVLKLRR